MSSCYIIDTSYLDELLKVDNKHEKSAAAMVKQKFSAATAANASFVVPVPVLFELANHITQVDHAVNRNKLSQTFQAALNGSLESDIPWHITPCNNSELFASINHALVESAQQFVTQFAAQQISLTDTLVSLTANSYKHKYPHRKVHIWTRDASLKALEPDKEVAPFV